MLDIGTIKKINTPTWTGERDSDTLYASSMQSDPVCDEVDIGVQSLSCYRPRGFVCSDFYM